MGTEILAFAALTVVAQSDVPRGWILAGSKPAEYEVGVDRETVHDGQPSAFLGLWMRVDKESWALAFHNMQDRAIKATTGWQKYEVVLDVEKETTGIAFGVLLTGPGRVWLSGTKLEVVSSDVPTTGAGGTIRPTAPVNLDFTE